MATNTTTLPGSHLEPTPGLIDARPVRPDERIEVSVYFNDPAAIDLTRIEPRQTPAVAALISREDLVQGRVVQFTTDLAKVAGFASAHGLGITTADAARRLVQLAGSAAQMKAAFGAELECATVDGVTSRVRRGSLHLPSDLVDRVQAVLGLDTRPIATPKFVPYAGAAAAGSYLPTEIAALYGFPLSGAAGQCIGIIELGGGYTDADNSVAFATMGLPVPAIVAVPVSGGANSPTGDGADGEVALDIQVVGGTAPGAKIAVYFAPNTSQGFVDAITQAVHDSDNNPSVISISWGSAESGWSGQAIAAMNAAFKDAAALGVTVLAASGDSLATDGQADGRAHVDYPASDPYVIGCGGTHIESSGATLSKETVWNSNGTGTGGGVSVQWPLPAYQANAGVPAGQGGMARRGVPDVSADADPGSGYRIVLGGRTGVIGGTSAVAPLWSALIAVLNTARGKPLGFVSPQLYASASAFRDITVGDNRVGDVGYTAGPGWDACTGLGSPDGAALLKALAIA